MRVNEFRIKHLVLTLNQNTGKTMTCKEWTKLVDKSFPYADVKDSRRYSYEVKPYNSQYVNLTYFSMLCILGFVLREEVLPVTGKKVKRFQFTPIKEIPLSDSPDYDNNKQKVG